MADESLEDLEHFAPTGGRIVGVLGLLIAAGVAGLWVGDRDGVPAPVAAGALVGGVLAWASLLRPRVSVSRDTLHLRNMLETIHVPLAAIDQLVVRQVLAVRVGEKRFVSPAVGRKLRKAMRGKRPDHVFLPRLPDRLDDAVGPAAAPERPPTTVDYADHVEERLRERIADARTRHGVRAYSDEAAALARDVRRQPSWPEIVALVLSTALLVVTVVR
ncbi:hypothetical protein [Nocardioides dilutus]